MDIVTADLFMEGVDFKLNIEAIDLPDALFDVIVCNHVLEHVDDKRALAEMYRILKPNGFCIITVPIIESWDKTYENAAVHTESERFMHFGQSDHIRIYGRDFRDRIKGAGFSIEEFTGTGDDCVKYGLMRGERVFILQRKSPTALQ